LAHLKDFEGYVVGPIASQRPYGYDAIAVLMNHAS
jgi:hypothetical protein